MDESKCFICAKPATTSYKGVDICSDEFCLTAMKNGDERGSFTYWVGDNVPEQNKSVLDGVPAVEVDLNTGERKPLAPGRFPGFGHGLKGVVGSCPSCGAPIYGHTAITDKEIPKATYSCECRNAKSKDIRDTMETK